MTPTDPKDKRVIEITLIITKQFHSYSDESNRYFGILNYLQDTKHKKKKTHRISDRFPTTGKTAHSPDQPNKKHHNVVYILVFFFFFVVSMYSHFTFVLNRAELIKAFGN